jgi:acetamidase/formamidase
VDRLRYAGRPRAAVRVELRALEVRGWGWTSHSPDFGFLGDELDEAARKATRHMIDYLVAERGLTRGDAYALASLAGDLKINEVVDVPHVLVSMHMPKGIFR